MEDQKKRKEALRQRIGQVLKSRETGFSDLSGKTVEEILQEISIYHQELEFQNLELMRIQDELEKSEKHYEELFSNAPVGYVLIDKNGIIHSANKMLAEMLEQETGKLKSKNLNLFVHPGYQDRFYLLIRKVLREKGKSSQLVKVMGAKKEYFVKMECNLLNANNKELLRIGLLDVTREVINEQQLAESRERYRAVADFAYHWEYWQDPEGRLLYMSPSCERITGYSKNEFFQNPELIEAIIHPDDQECFYEHKKFATAPDEKVVEHSADYRIFRKNGQIIWIGHVCQNIFNEEGKHIGLRATNRDITERKKTRQKLADQQLVMSDILESTLSGYWDWNIAANVEYFSPAFKKMLGYEYHELPNVPETWQKLIFPEDLPGVLEIYDKHVQSKGKVPFYNEVRYKHKDGSTVWVICAGRVIEWDDDGTPVRMVGCHVDITRRKKLEEKTRKNELELKQKNEEYAALNKELLQANNKLRQTSEKLYQSELDLKEQYEESAARNEELIQINEELQSLTEELVESNERNNALVGANPDLMFVYDRGGGFLDYHAPNRQILLLKPEEFLNKNVSEVLPGYLADLTRQAITQLFETGEPQHYSYTIETRGEKNHFDARMVKYGKNNALAIIRDVTDQKTATEKLRQSQETYLGIINSVSESIYVQDENGVFLEVNDAATASYGLKREDIIGKTPGVLSAAGKNDLERLDGMIKKAFKGEPQRFEFWGRKADGTVFPDEVALTKGVYFGKPVVIALARNISERKKAEEALRESEERFKLSMEATNDGLWDWNVETDEAYFSPAFYTMLGYEVGEFPATGKSLKDLLHPGDKETALSKNRACIEGDTGSFEVEFRLKTREGSWLWVLSRGKCVERDKNGKAVRVVGTHLNINDRKNAEDEILKRELLLNKIFDVLPIGLWFADDNGKLLRGNPAGVKIWGGEPTVAPDEYGVFKARRLPSGEEIAPDDWALAHTVSKGETITGELIEIDAFDGQKRVILNYTAPVIDNEGGVLGAIVVNNDITELHKAQESLRANERMLQSISDNMFDLVALTDLEGNYTFTGASHRLLGYEKDQLTGTNVMEYVHPDDLPMVKDAFEEFIAKKQNNKRVTYRNRCSDDTYLWFETVGKVIFDEHDDPKELLFNSRDFTERKKAEEAIRQNEMILNMKNEEYKTLNNKLIESNERIKRINKELNAARKKAEESDMLKTAFLANMSHEIRTPMNAIIGFSEILLKPGLPNTKQERFTRILNTSCHQLLSVVDDIIDIAKIETGQLDIHIGKANINKAITRVKEIFMPQVSQTGVTINISFQLGDESAEIETDSVKLNQILTNLLSNAVKFTEEGEIEIGYYAVDEGIKIYVRDTGIGIKPEHHEMIFERFRQVEVDYTRKYGGAGLGLPICKAFVEKLGGRIWVESEFEKGSTFCFTLPCNEKMLPTQTAKDDEQVDYNLTGVLILVAEDEEANFIFMSELLTEVGAMVIHAADGFEAVNMFRENANIDIVLMDIKMPGMDGIEATKAIRAINRNVPIIATTAYALTGDKEKCLAAGCDDYIPKPIVRKELLGLIGKYIDTHF